MTRLESDLEHHITAANVGAYIGSGRVQMTSGRGQRAGTSSSMPHERSGVAAGGAGAPDAALLQLLSEDELGRSAEDSIGGGSSEKDVGGARGGGSTTASGQHQMIGILQAQRDRYKERLDNVSHISIGGSIISCFYLLCNVLMVIYLISWKLFTSRCRTNWRRQRP